jgi:serine/threonine-protein phosphatase 2B catalytic subunit
MPFLAEKITGMLY